MSSFKKLLEDSLALSVLREAYDGEKRFICYTSFSDSESLWEIAWGRPHIILYACVTPDLYVGLLMDLMCGSCPLARSSW